MLISDIAIATTFGRLGGILVETNRQGVGIDKRHSGVVLLHMGRDQTGPALSVAEGLNAELSFAISAAMPFIRLY